MWAPTRALLSAHSGYHDLAWGDIQNTLTTAQINAGDAKTPNGVRNNDHPKVYVAWSKHAHFDTRNTGWNDPVSQSTDNAFRSDDWWYYVDKSYYVSSSVSFMAVRGQLTSIRFCPTIPRPLAKLSGLRTGAMQLVTLLLCRQVCALRHDSKRVRMRLELGLK
jgi:hypothetical protein